MVRSIRPSHPVQLLDGKTHTIPFIYLNCCYSLTLYSPLFSADSTCSTSAGSNYPYSTPVEAHSTCSITLQLSLSDFDVSILDAPFHSLPTLLRFVKPHREAIALSSHADEGQKWCFFFPFTFSFLFFFYFGLIRSAELGRAINQFLRRYDDVFSPPSSMSFQARSSNLLILFFVRKHEMQLTPLFLTTLLLYVALGASASAQEGHLTVLLNVSVPYDLGGGRMSVSEEHCILLTFLDYNATRVGAIDLNASGKLLWERSVPSLGPVDTAILALGDIALFVYFDPMWHPQSIPQMTAYDIRTGTQRWFKKGLQNTVHFNTIGSHRVKGQVAYFLAGQKFNRYVSLNLTNGEIFQQQIVSGGAFIGDDYVLLSGLLPQQYPTPPTVGAPTVWMVNLNTNQTEWKGPALALNATEYYTVLDANEQYGVLSKTIYTAASGLSVNPNLHIINPFTGDLGLKIDLTVYWPQPVVAQWKTPTLFGSRGDVLQVGIQTADGWNGTTVYLNVSDGYQIWECPSPYWSLFSTLRITNGVVVANLTAGSTGQGELQYQLFVGGNKVDTISHSPLPYGKNTVTGPEYYPAGEVFLLTPQEGRGFQLMNGMTPEVAKPILDDPSAWLPRQLRSIDRSKAGALVLVIEQQEGHVLVLKWSP
jgi:hypothetical protein